MLVLSRKTGQIIRKSPDSDVQMGLLAEELIIRHYEYLNKKLKEREEQT